MQSNFFPAQFQARSLELLENLVKVSGCIFCLVKPDLKHQGVYVSNIPSDIDGAYTSIYYALDPLNAQNFVDTSTKIVTLDSQISPQELIKSRYYLEFMKKYQHRYVVDIFLRNSRKEMIAVISLLRSYELGDFTHKEIDTLYAVHGFIEYSLNSVYLPKRDTDRQYLSNQYHFTEREFEVIELLVSGASNKDIARRINMGIATLKTHLNHIYRKVEVQSRTELTAKILSEI